MVALTVGLYYLFRYVNSYPLANIVFYAALWVIGIFALLRRYSKRRASKSNIS